RFGLGSKQKRCCAPHSKKGQPTQDPSSMVRALTTPLWRGSNAGDPVMRPLLAAAVLTLLAALPVHAQSSAYQVEIEKDRDGKDRIHLTERNIQGKKTTYVTVQFRVGRLDRPDLPANDIHKEWFKVKEDGRDVEDLEIYQLRGQDRLTAVLAIDISGSMRDHGKIEKARAAAQLFLSRLHAEADCGLILFDHQIRTAIPPAGSGADLVAHRQHISQEVAAAQP